MRWNDDQKASLGLKVKIAEELEKTSMKSLLDGEQKEERRLSLLNKKMQLIETVQDCFGGGEDDDEDLQQLEAKEDLAILYEITGF